MAVYRERIKELKKYATYRKYRDTHENHIRKTPGKYPVTELSADMIKEILKCPDSSALSESSLWSIAGVINQILSYAETHYHVIPARFSSRKLRMPRKPIKVLNQSEQTRLGEICALK